MKLCLLLPFLSTAVLAAPQQQHGAHSIEPIKVLNATAYEEGGASLRLANDIFSRMMLTQLLHNTSLPEEYAPFSAAIDKLWKPNQERADLAVEILEKARRAFRSAVAPEDFRKMNKKIRDAIFERVFIWDRINKADVHQLARLATANTSAEDSEQLREANGLWNFGRLVDLISTHQVPDDIDTEGNAAVRQLSQSKKDGYQPFERSFDKIENSFKKKSDALEFALWEARAELIESWRDIKEKEFSRLPVSWSLPVIN